LSKAAKTLALDHVILQNLYGEFTKMSSSSSNDVIFGVGFIGLIIASQLNRLGLLSSTNELQLAEAEVPHHHSHAAAVAMPSPSPSPIPLPPESTSWFPDWFIWVMVIVGALVVIVIVYQVLSQIRKETEERCEALERIIKEQQTWIEEHEWMASRLSNLSDEVRADRAQTQQHRKMLKILKQMPSYQVQAATMIVSAAVVDPNAAKEAREQLKSSASNPSAWEQEGEVKHER
jgi:hypothetical protein